MYAVVQPDSPHYGIVISRHRTREAAQAAIDRELNALRAQSGQRSSWLDRRIVETTARGERIPLVPGCTVCSEPIPEDRVYAARSRGVAARYCSERCKTTATRRRQRARRNGAGA